MTLRIAFSMNFIAVFVVAMFVVAAEGLCQSPLGVFVAKATRARSVCLPRNELQLRALEHQQFLSGMARVVLFNATDESVAIYQQCESPKNGQTQTSLLFDRTYYQPLQIFDDLSRSLRE